MSAPENRGAWRWLAITAVAFLCLACADANIASARTFSHPILAALVGHQDTTDVSNSAVLRFVQEQSRVSKKASRHAADDGFWAAMLPVLFVGLMAPLGLLSPKPILRLGHPPAAPLLPSAFQRPPPVQLLSIAL